MERETHISAIKGEDLLGLSQEEKVAVSPLHLNLGCGPLPLHHQHLNLMEQYPGYWVLVDKFIDNAYITKWDVEKLDEVENGCVDTIYASHLLEHISWRKVPEILSLWYQKLKPGGVILINVPDLRWMSEQLIRLDEGKEIESGYFKDFYGEHGIIEAFYGSHEHDGEYHKTGFTQNQLDTLLKDIGLKQVFVKRLYDAHQMGILWGGGVK